MNKQKLREILEELKEANRKCVDDMPDRQINILEALLEEDPNPYDQFKDALSSNLWKTQQ